MLLSYNPKFIFIHIPKTAGTSISECLRTVATGKVEMGGQKLSWDFHTTARLCEYRLGANQFANSFTFSFVRNPWDWMYSWYSMHSKDKGKEYTFKHWLMEYEHIMSRTFMWDEIPIASQRRGQMGWITDKAGNIIVDFVGRFENLEKDFDVVRDKLKITKKLPKHNTSVRGDYKAAYDNEMIEFVYKYCEKEIKEFGYEYQ